MGTFELSQRTAIVTGAARGFGRAIAERLGGAGAEVIGADIRPIEWDETGLLAETHQCDVSAENEVASLIAGTAQAHGLDILVNNAGVFRGGAVDVIESEDLERELKVNFASVVWGIKYASRYMHDGSAIVSVASHAGLRGVPTYGGYVASKAAVIGYTKTAALELAAQGIRVNCVCPGTHETDMNLEVDAGVREMRIASLLQPLGRCGSPEELAALVHFLVSPDCAFITGQAIPIDGGKSAGPGPAVMAALEDALDHRGDAARLVPRTPPQ